MPILNKQSILYDVRTIDPEENCAPFMVRVWFRVRHRKRVGGNFPRGQLS